MAGSTLDPDAPKRRRRKAPEGSDVSEPSEAERLREEIARAAYYRAERRGFAPGCEEEDWIAAEEEVKSRRKARQ